MNLVNVVNVTVIADGGPASVDQVFEYRGSDVLSRSCRRRMKLSIARNKKDPIGRSSQLHRTTPPWPRINSCRLLMTQLKLNRFDQPKRFGRLFARPAGSVLRPIEARRKISYCTESSVEKQSDNVVCP